MAYEGIGQVVESFPAGEDLSAKQFYFVALNSSKQVILPTARGQKCIGVLQNKPTSGQSASVLLFGVSKVNADAAIAVGDPITTAADGQASPVTSEATGEGHVNTSDTGGATDSLKGSFVMGQCLLAVSNAGEIATALIMQMGAIPGTTL